MPTPIFVINLRKDSTRLSLMTEQLNRLGLGFERVEGVHGLNMEAWLDPYFLGSDHTVASKLLPGEVGCYASHLVVCSKVAELTTPALVLEDDVALPDDLQTLLESLEALPAGWDIIRLSNPSKRKPVLIRALTDTYNLIKYTRVPPSTGAYFISQSGAEKFLAMKGARTLPVDQDLRRVWEFGMRTLGVFPRPIEPDTGSSSIDEMHMRSRKKLRKMYGVSDYIARSWNEICWLGFSAWISSRILLKSTSETKQWPETVPRGSAKRLSESATALARVLDDV